MGLGVRIPNQDAAAIARGNAFVATADNPSAIYYNPAGITQLDGHNVQFGSLFYLGIDADYQSPTGSREGNHSDVLPVPNLHYVFTPSTFPVSFGLGLYAPFGLSMEWDDDAPFRTAGYEGELQYLTLNPVVAWEINRHLSIAAGPTLNYSELLLKRGLGAVPGDSLKFDGDDEAIGYSAGILWHPLDQVAFGASYRSPTRLEYDGTATISPGSLGQFLLGSPEVNTTTHADFPQVIVVGISLRPTKNWNVEFNVDWADWETVDRVLIDNVGSLPLNWQSSFFYEAGATYSFGNGYIGSLGYFFSENSTSEKNFTPIVPDTDLHVGSLGVGYRGTHWNWMVSGQIIAGGWRTVNESVDPSANGQYKLFIPTLSFSVGYHF